MRGDTKQRILDAATRVFSDRGFDGARMERIAAAAGVNKATIYYHIGGKKALYGTVLHAVLRQTVARLKQRITTDQPPEEKLTAYIQNFVRAVEENPRIAPIILREMAAGGKGFPPIVVKEFIKTISLLGDILYEGVDSGAFVRINPLLMHLMIIGPVALYSRVRSVAANRSDIPPDVLASGILGERIEDILTPRILAAVRKSARLKPDRRST